MVSDIGGKQTHMCEVAGPPSHTCLRIGSCTPVQNLIKQTFLCSSHRRFVCSSMEEYTDLCLSLVNVKPSQVTPSQAKLSNQSSKPRIQEPPGFSLTTPSTSPKKNNSGHPVAVSPDPPSMSVATQSFISRSNKLHNFKPNLCLLLDPAY